MASTDNAITDIRNRVATPITGTLGGTTLTSGVFLSTSNLDLTGTLTLDANNDPNAIFIIRSDSYLVTAASSSVVLARGAQAKNVYWSTGTYFSAGADSILKGNVLASTYISIGAGTTIEGRLFSQNEYISFGAGSIESAFGIAGIGTVFIKSSGTIPSVLGLTQSAANTSLTNAGFTLGAVTTTASGATASNNGQVVTQSASGVNQLYATPVDLVLYAYVAPATSGTIPSVLGLTQSAANTSLTNAGFTLGAVTTTASGATASNNGQVVTQSASGVNQLYATPVDLVLYAYVAPATSGTIPSILGLTETAARAAISGAGFLTGNVTTISDGATDENSGQAATQSPSASSSQLFSTPVNFVLYLDLTPPNVEAPSVDPNLNWVEEIRVSAQAVAATEVYMNRTIYFSPSKANLSEKSKKQLISMMKTLKSRSNSNSTMTITLTGSVSKTKSGKNDKNLATARAKAVRAVLKKNVPDTKFVILTSKATSSKAKFRNVKVAITLTTRLIN